MKNKSVKKLFSFFTIVSMVLLLSSLVFAATPTATGLLAPTNLVSTAGDSQINLTWSSVSGATNYNVYQSLDGITYNLISEFALITTPSYDVTGLTNGKLYYFKIAVANTGEESTYSTVVSDTPSVRTAPVNLGTAGDYAILAKTGISSVPNSVITGNIGVSPIDSTAITGFSLTVDATNEFSTSTQVTGKVHASDYASPTPSNLTTSISNMETAYIDAAGRAVNYTELYTGDISGQTLTAGVYKWGTGVLINSDVTLHGGPNDVFIFQIAKGITQANGTKIILTGGAQAKNIFWQSSETVAIGTNAHFEGIVLGKTNITLGTLASVNGRLLAQTAVTLIKSTVVAPAKESHDYSISIIGNPTIKLGQSASYVYHIFDNGTEVFDQSVQWSVRNQDNSTPIIASITAGTGNSATITIGSESSYVNKYIVLSATLTGEPSTTIEKPIQINSLD
ncbi:MAG: ice-binding family protein [Bacillus sp. (in: Bacteria)]|nr:ice-binding family protein [Bacillus sp. (in: firmicutes)]